MLFKIKGRINEEEVYEVYAIRDSSNNEPEFLVFIKLNGEVGLGKYI